VDTREFSGVTREQLEGVQDFLAANPIKVPEGEWKFWEFSEQDLEDEARRTVLREAIRRYRHEIMGHDERLMLEDRIRRLRRSLGIVT
jgi:hypothetical protein